MAGNCASLGKAQGPTSTTSLSTDGTMRNQGRREFLVQTSLSASSLAVAAAFQAFLGRDLNAARRREGPAVVLRPVPDEATGLPLLQLPEGFRYLSHGWTGDPLADGTPTPGVHDGMAVIQTDANQLVICRNHELSGNGRPFADAARCFDPHGPGGCVILTFDQSAGAWGKGLPSISGTVKNCAGGPTPWGTWLTCEETVFGPGDEDDGERLDYEREHGWIFEVPAGGITDPQPLKAMGRFVHEAVAVDPRTGIVYETEDAKTAGFYRFVPNRPGELTHGGRLQMLSVASAADLRRLATVGQTFDVRWVDIAEPERAHSPETTDRAGVFQQGKAQHGTTFARLEGCWFGNDRIYFVSTSGGTAEAGQVWEYDPVQEQLRLLFESPSRDVLDSPDNITVRPQGGIVLCEDGDHLPNRLHGLTSAGELFPIAANNTVLHGERNRISGDFRDQEWAGATFSPDGRWLFVNLQKPGITLAITGPWSELGL